MQESDFIFSKSVVTRFSHDLAGVISAVSNSLSLLEELGGGDEETLKLATENATVLMGRLRFFRAAFGNEGPLTDIGVTRKIFEEYLSTLENRAIHYECAWETDEELPIFVFRLILLGGVIAAEQLPRGGKITVCAKAGSHFVCLQAQGSTVSPISSEETISGNMLLPKAVPVVFLQKCCAEQDWQMTFSCQDGKAVIELGKTVK